MSKTTAPLLGFEAAGQIGKTQVYAKWKGRGYARRYIVPANPNTGAQQLTRNVFSFLTQTWKIAPSEFQEAWQLYAKGQVLTDRNAFNKFNIGPLRPETDTDLFVWSPGAGGGLLPASATAGVGTAHEIIMQAFPPTPPGSGSSQWLVTGVYFAIQLQSNPQTDPSAQIIAAVEDTPSSGHYDHTFSGLTTGDVYQWGAWIKWQKGTNGLYAFGQAISAQATVT